MGALETYQEKMAKTLSVLKEDLNTVRAGRANPSSLDGVMVNYYGAMTPLRNLANITVPEARQLLIKPFDRGALAGIEKGIYDPVIINEASAFPGISFSVHEINICTNNSKY